MSGFPQDFLFCWVRQHAVIAALHSTLSNILRGREINKFIIMATACMVQMLRGMQVWMLLASTFLAHAMQTQHQHTDELLCPVSIFHAWEMPTCSIYEGRNHNDSYLSVESPATVPDPGPSTAAQSQDVDVNELDAESPLDNANFLSFEDWKKQNLAKIGQSADNVGGRRQGSDISKERRTQARVMNNALDALGDDAEIELNFAAFDPEAAQPSPWEADRGSTNTDGGTSEADDSADSVSGVGRRKDAGTTCKERFNYASFDCAATVLKTNPECSGSSSILIENKDSYMLNECRAKNKFLILELCDDILVDTVVLANYEFFSSIFHTFKVSVSDRYPAKADKWKELGVFEAKNTREVQAFAVENPLIWARYVRIEFLTHYGNEFYCPLSLVRVHGTTMLEEYKNEGDTSRSDEEIMDEAAEFVGKPEEAEQAASAEEQVADKPNLPILNSLPDVFEKCTPLNGSVLEIAALKYAISETAICNASDDSAVDLHATSNQTNTNTHIASPPATGTANTTIAVSPDSKGVSDHTRERNEQYAQSETNMDSRYEYKNATSRSSGPDSAATKTSVASGDDSTSTLEPSKVASPPPPSPNPTTQESFFKSVNKRLQMLESNSTLSLLYIEEQSRMLRDAFSIVEKRQLAKMNQFLEDLNSTVIDEIKNLHLVYQSLRTIVLDDFEHQQREVSTAASQLAVLTNELVFQKRMTALSSVLIMILFVLILFPRGSGVVGGIDFHSMIAWSPRPASSAKVLRIPSTGPSSPSLGSETQTPPSNLSKKETRRRQCSNALGHESIKDLHDCSNPSALSSEEDLRFADYTSDGRFRSRSNLSDSDMNKTRYTTFSSNIRHMLGYEQISSPARTSLSPKPPHDRPVSSPPVLKRSGRHSDDHAASNGVIADIRQDDDSEGGADSDTSTEPFPPFPSNQNE